MKNNKKKIIFSILIIFFIIYIIVFIYNLIKPLPEGISYKSNDVFVPENDIAFLYDLTYTDKNGNLFHQQEIFDSIFYHIDNAEKYILVDMFLYNSCLGNANKTFRDITGELTSKLIEKKKNNPNIEIDFITDPINTVYNGSISEEIEKLKKSNINIIITNLNYLRDSNPVYSAFWRLFIKVFSNSKKVKILPHPFSKKKEKVSIRSYLALLNFKANHRKIFLSDYKDKMVSFVMSANPHNGSAAHSNIAFKITGDFWETLYYSENSLAKFSNKSFFNYKSYYCNEIKNKQKEKNIIGINDVKVNLITEGKIKKSLIDLIKKTEKDNVINIAMFYLSERKIIKELINASKKGVNIRLILDPNKDAFGYKKKGTPNRQVANELIRKSKGNIKIRWYDTHGEQFHTKLIEIKKKNNTAFVLGSANLTRRNISDFNLESDVLVICNNESRLTEKINTYYEKIWNNNKNNYTVEYNKYKKENILSTIFYRFLEFSGICTF